VKKTKKSAGKRISNLAKKVASKIARAAKAVAKQVAAPFKPATHPEDQARVET
jgi:hypothetical protein